MAVSTFSELKSAVETRMARSDFPSDVYDLATAELNAELRLREMETSATLSASSETVALPSDFLMARAAYVDTTPRVHIEFSTAAAEDWAFSRSGIPTEAVIEGDNLRLNPVPDGTYSIVLRYLARLDAFSNDADTNDVLSRYPALYIYSACKHVAIWAQDQGLAGVYASAFDNELRQVQQQDRSARHGGGPLRTRTKYMP